MVKTPKVRHSKSRREPMTIDLEPGAVSRMPSDQAQVETPNPEAAAEQAANASQPAAPEDATPVSAPEDAAPGEETIRAEEADFEPWEGDESAAAAAVDPESGVQASVEEGSSGGSASGQDYSFAHDETPRSKPAESFAKREETADRTAAATAPAPAPPRRSGINGVAAGLVGGVIALVGAGALQFAGILGAPGQGGVPLDGVNAEIASLKTELAALKGADNGDAAAKVDGLAAALDQVKTDVAALKSAVDSGGAGDSAALEALSGKVKEIETTVAALGQASNTAPVDLGPLNEKLAGLDALVKTAGETATKQEGRLAALEQSVSSLTAKVDAQAAQPKIALAIAASALKAALDRGAPFSAELETFAAISPDAPQIATLRPYAENGVPTRADIAAETDAAANAMIAAASPPQQNAGFFERLLSSAESLVKVRPIGAVEGPGVPETVARMEVAVNQGDYAKALGEYDTLPDTAKAAGADFAAKLKARIEVEAQVDALIAGAMKA